MVHAPKTVLITGGSGGIGSATVRLFHARGYAVAHVSDRPPMESLPEGVCEFYGDITDPDVRQKVVDQTIQRFGRIDVLINNAAVSLYAMPTTTEVAHAERLFAVNVIAPIALTKLVLPIMQRQGEGVIVNTGSVAGYVSMPWAAVYCATKFALNGWHDSLYRELKGSSIHAMKVCPGVVRTAIRDHVISGKAPDNVLKLRWVTSPERVARAIVRGVEKKSRAVYVPLYGLPFILVDQLLPWVMDLYLANKSK